MSYLELELATIDDGKAVAQFNFELQRAIDNCKDVATEATTVREVILKVKIKPNAERTKGDISYQAKSKLCPDAAGSDLLVFTRAGASVSSARQLNLDEQGEHNVEEFDPATGEVKEEGGTK